MAALTDITTQITMEFSSLGSEPQRALLIRSDA
jgi:hypothetical protein